MLQGLVYSLYYAERWKADRARIRAAIEELGGKVLGFQQPGMFIRSPFAPIGNHPLYFKVHVEHGERSGTWFVRTTLDRPNGEWVWRDAGGEESLPVELAEARVDNSIVEIGPILGTLLYVGVIGLFVWLIFWFYGFRF